MMDELHVDPVRPGLLRLEHENRPGAGPPFAPPDVLRARGHAVGPIPIGVVQPARAQLRDGERLELDAAYGQVR